MKNVYPTPVFRRLGVCALAAGLILPPLTHANFTLVDDFETYEVGSVANIESPWVPHGNSTLTQVAAEGDNQYLNNGWNSNFRSGSRALPEGTEIGPGEQATFFLQFRAGSDDLVASFGLAHEPDVGNHFPFEDFRVEVRLEVGDSEGLLDLALRDGDSYRTVGTVVPGTWHNLWLVVDRTDGDRFRAYLSIGGEDAEETDRLAYEDGGETVDTFAFRDDGTPDDVVGHVMVTGNTQPSLQMHYDNLWIDNDGENLIFTGVDFEAWQFAYEEIDAPVALDFGTGTGQDDGERLLRNRIQDFSLQSSHLRLEPSSQDLVSTSALANVGNYLDRQDFSLEADVVLQRLADTGEQRVGLAVLGGPHVPIEAPFNTAADSGYYGLVWVPAPDPVDGVIESRIEIREGFGGEVLASAVWEGRHPNMGNPFEGVGETYTLAAEGAYDLSGAVALTLTVTDQGGHSQSVSTVTTVPEGRNLFGIGGYLEREEVEDDPQFDFAGFSLTLGDEPVPLIPTVSLPFSFAFGSASGRNPGDDFVRNEPDDWSLTGDALRLGTAATDLHNSFAMTRVGNFEAESDFSLSLQMTLAELDAGGESRVGMLLFGEEDPEVFDPADHGTYHTLQWILDESTGGSLVLREGMDGPEVARVDFDGLPNPPSSPSAGDPQAGVGLRYTFVFEGAFDGGGDLVFDAALRDETGGEALVSGSMTAPPATNRRFGFGARHRAADGAQWDFNRFQWSDFLPVSMPLFYQFGTADGRDGDESFLKSGFRPEDWSLEVESLRQSRPDGSAGAGYENSTAVANVFDYVPGGDFAMRSTVTATGLDDGEFTRLGLAFFGRVAPGADGPGTDFYETSFRLQWLPHFGDGGQLRFDSSAFGSQLDGNSGNGELRHIFLGDESGSFATNSTNAITLGAAGSSGSRRLNSAVFFFELPELGPGESIHAAEFSVVEVDGRMQHDVFHDEDIAVDLHGLGFQSTASLSDVGAEEYWKAGPSDPDESGIGIPNTRLLQQRFLTPPETEAEFGRGRFPSSEEASLHLADFLNELYANGAEPGDFAVIRLSFDTFWNPNSDISRYIVSGAESGGDNPRLSLTVSGAGEFGRAIDLAAVSGAPAFEQGGTYTLELHGFHNPDGSLNLTAVLSDENGGEAVLTQNVTDPAGYSPGSWFGMSARFREEDNPVFDWHTFEMGTPEQLGIEPPDFDVLTFEEWREDQFTAAELEDPSISGPEGTPAGDGVVNLIKFAFGFDAKTPVAAADLPQAEVVAEGLQLRYLERMGAEDIEYHPESSEGLGVWNRGSEFVEEIGRVNAGDGFHEVTVRAVLPDDASRGFLRVTVSRN